MAAGWWIGIRNRLLASPAFRRFALRFPVTQPIARRHAGRLFDLVAGFTYSQTLFACVELGLFDRLAGNPEPILILAASHDIPEPAFRRLVDAATALGLLQTLPGDRVTLGESGAAMVGNSGVAAMVAHHRHLYADLADPVALLRLPGSGALAAFWPYANGSDPDAVARYSALMAASVTSVAEQLIDSYDVSRHRRLLDVGGGEGRFLAAVRARAPGLALGLFDLPAVVERARARVVGIDSFHPGDFRAGPIPAGYDCITLVRIVHDHDDAVVARLFAQVRRALPPGGTLLIVEPMRGDVATYRLGSAYFGWYLQAMGSGRVRTPAEIGTLLTTAGFSRWTRRRTALPLTTSVIVAHT